MCSSDESEVSREQPAQIGCSASNLHDTLKPTGYTLATGAPQEPTKADILALLMLIPDVDEACRMKWERGLLEHRGGDTSLEFQGDPLAELHSEGLDALNFIAQLEGEGYDREALQLLRESAMNLVQGARNLNGSR